MSIDRLPQFCTWVECQRFMLDDEGLDVDLFCRELHEEQLSQRGYVAVGTLKIARSNGWYGPRAALHITSETAVSWKPRADQG